MQPVCNYLCTSLIKQAINPVLCKCKHSQYHHILYLFLLLKLSSIFFKVLLPAPSFCLHKTEHLFQLCYGFQLVDVCTCTHMEWGMVRKREGLGGAERDCPHVHENAHHHFQIRRSQERKLLYRSLKNISHAIFVWKTKQQKKTSFSQDNAVSF